MLARRKDKNSHIILEQLMRSSIVFYFCTEDGQKVGRNRIPNKLILRELNLRTNSRRFPLAPSPPYLNHRESGISVFLIR